MGATIVTQHCKVPPRGYLPQVSSGFVTLRYRCGLSVIFFLQSNIILEKHPYIPNKNLIAE